MDTLTHDLRAAIRQWLRAPGLALVAVLVMGLGAGGTLALFGLLDALVLRKLPVPRPDEIVAIDAVDQTQPDNNLPVPLAALERLADRQTVFSGVAGYGGLAVTTGGADPDARWVVSIDAVTGRYFDVLAVRPAAGRLISVEDVAESSPVAVVSYDYWQRRLGGNPAAVGQRLVLQGAPFTIVGITQKGFTGLDVGDSTDVTIPIKLLPRLEEFPPDYPLVFQMIGRLAPGVPLTRARSQLQTWQPIEPGDPLPSVFTAEERTEFLTSRFEVTPAATGFGLRYRQIYAKPLSLLVVGSGLVLLLACANISTLLLARAASREHELGVRAAIGASPARLVRQVLTECVLLSAVATAASVPIAHWTANSLSLMMWEEPDFPPFTFTPDPMVLLAIFACAIGSGLLFGLLPAYRATRADVLLSLRTTGTAAARTRRWGQRLLVAQVAMGVTLFVVAWLVTDNLRQIARPPFAFEGVSLAGLESTGLHERQSKIDPSTYCRRLIDELSRIGRLESAALSSTFPLVEGEDRRMVGASGAPSDGGARAAFVSVSPGFFRTLGLPVIRGRDFTWSDDGTHPRVAILSAGLARQIFGDRDPVGRHIQTGAGIGAQGASQPDIEVIGITVDARLTDLHDPRPQFVFTPLLQDPFRAIASPFVVLRARAPLTAIAGDVRRSIEALGQDRVAWTRTFSDQMNRSLLRERLMTVGATYFGSLAAAVLAVGIAGVLAYSVSKRTREIGLRAALGASSRSLQFMVVRDAMEIASLGLLLGLPCAWMATRLLRGVLTAVSDHEPLAFVSAAVITIAVSLVAAWLPSHRAAAITPLNALRSE